MNAHGTHQPRRSISPSAVSWYSCLLGSNSYHLAISGISSCASRSDRRSGHSCSRRPCANYRALRRTFPRATRSVCCRCIWVVGRCRPWRLPPASRGQGQPARRPGRRILSRYVPSDPFFAEATPWAGAGQRPARAALRGVVSTGCGFRANFGRRTTSGVTDLAHAEHQVTVVHRHRRAALRDSKAQYVWCLATIYRTVPDYPGGGVAIRLHDVGTAWPVWRYDASRSTRARAS